MQDFIMQPWKLTNHNQKPCFMDDTHLWLWTNHSVGTGSDDGIPLMRNTLILYDRRTIVDKIAYKDAKKAFFVYSSLEAWTRANSETSTWLQVFLTTTSCSYRQISLR